MASPRSAAPCATAPCRPASPPPTRPRPRAAYRNNVAVSLGQALGRRFPVIQRLVGDEFFAALARAYLAADPPRSPVLMEWGAGFADFLAGFRPLAGWPFMADVARIEWARGLAFHAADAPPWTLPSWPQPTLKRCGWPCTLRSGCCGWTIRR